MPPNLSMFTEFGLFRNSNFVTAYEHVASSYIDAYVYSFVVPLLETVTRNLNLVKKKHKSQVSGNYVYFYQPSQKECQHSDYDKHVARYLTSIWRLTGP